MAKFETVLHMFKVKGNKVVRFSDLKLECFEFLLSLCDDYRPNSRSASSLENRLSLSVERYVPDYKMTYLE